MSASRFASESDKRSVADRIREVATTHNITYRPGRLDSWVDKVAELSGDNITPDETRDLILALQRHGVISQIEAMRLHIEYYRERSGG